MSANAFLETLAGRRSYYALKKESPISDARIQEIIVEIIKHIPSSFNSQTTRVVLLVKEEHDKLWEITKEVLKPIVPADGWSATEGKLNMFKGAYATVLFFNHVPTITEFQTNFKLYAERFPHWAAQSAGAHEIALWAALEAEGLGANLQHYNPLIDQRVRDTWGLSPDWALDAQLVIGTPAAPVGEKTFKQVEGERFKVFGV